MRLPSEAFPAKSVEGAAPYSIALGIQRVLRYAPNRRRWILGGHPAQVMQTVRPLLSFSLSSAAVGEPLVF
jgi:hypothetical protein